MTQPVAPAGREAGLVNRWVSRALAAGSLLATAVTAAGVAAWLAAGAPRLDATRPDGWVAAIRAGEPAAIIGVGLLLVALIPLGQVAVGLLAFARLGERRYVIVSLAVLLILLASLTGAILVGLDAGR
jgi:hypothetical protein